MSKHIFLTSLILLCGFFVACTGETLSQQPPTVTVASLNGSPEAYLNQEIQVTGSVLAEGEEQSFSIPSFYVTADPCYRGGKLTTCVVTKMGLRQVIRQPFVFGTSTTEIKALVESQAQYIPLLYSPATKKELSEGQLILTGTWVQGEDGGYYLDVSECRKLKLAFYMTLLMLLYNLTP